MPLIEYRAKNFRPATEEIIGHANAIIAAYQEQDLTLTLRQLYYRFVAADLIPNTSQSYDRLGSIINDARLAGRVDWEAIEDRGRELERLARWRDPADLIESAARQYHLDHWQGQEYRPEVWVEKQALEAVVGQACEPLDVPYFSCKGYTSQSEMWRAAGRFERYARRGQQPVIIHLGDHDPSGIDMTRDITERINYLFGVEAQVVRIALNMDQVEEFGPPPNPAKVTDSRAAGYIARYGTSSWELDALEPAYMQELIQRHIQDHCEGEKWDAVHERQEEQRRLLKVLSEDWDEVVEALDLR
jgi:hypothetical protein